jgi:uncharacterized protein
VTAFHSNHIKQLAKAPKLLVCDSAQLCHLLGADRARLSNDDSLLGTVLECFLGMELVKQLSASRTRASLEHMRTATGAEVDSRAGSGASRAGAPWRAWPSPSRTL